MVDRNESAVIISAEYRTFPILQEDKSYSPESQEISYNTAMDIQDTVRHFIQEQSDLSPDSKGQLKKWSEAIGRNHAYLHQFINKKSPKKLSEDDRIALAKVMGVPEDVLRYGPSLSQHGKGTVNQPFMRPSPSTQSTLQLIPSEQLMGEHDLKVFSIVQGGRGALVLESDSFTTIARPRRLDGRKKAYGVLVKGNSMAREFNEGDIAYVDPHLHPRKGDPCIFQATREDGTVEAMIKYLERSPDASEKVYYVSQSNPPKKFTIKKAEWQTCHVAVGKESGR
jgi:hypothetical protein